MSYISQEDFKSLVSKLQEGTGKGTLKENYDKVVLANELWSDEEKYEVVQTLRDKGINAGTSAGNSSTILVPIGKAKEAASILTTAGYNVVSPRMQSDSKLEGTL